MSRLVLFALGGGLAYLAVTIVITVGLGAGLPLLGWIGFGVVAVLTLAASSGLAAFLVRSARGAGAGAGVPGRRAVSGARRVLVVTDEACSGQALAASLDAGPAEVLVVAPALVSPIHYLDSDVDAGRASAQARLAETVTALAASGIDVRGVLGSESPLEAIADALAFFPADEIIVATAPPQRRNWLEENLVTRARTLWNLPVSHVVVNGREQQ